MRDHASSEFRILSIESIRLMPCYLGVDLGTSGCRAIAIDAAGREIARHTAPLPPPIRRDDQVTQDPALWRTAFITVLRGITAELPMPPAAIAIDGTSATLVITDESGEPLDTAFMYNDTRARTQAQRIAGLAPRESGAHGPGSSLAKLLWWLEHRACERPARYALHQADWLASRLTGHPGITDENNALKMGYDPAARVWPPWIGQLALPEDLLPRVIPPGSAMGTVSAAAATLCGLPEGLPVIAGTTDSVAAFLATGAAEPGEAVTSLGSTLVIKLISTTAVFAPEYGIYSHRLGDRWLAGGASNSGGAVLLQFFTSEQMRTMTPRLRPDQPTGLDYYPLCAPGERFPVSDPHLRPRITPRPPDDVLFYQGLLEGIAGIEALGYRRLQELGAPPPVTIRTVGGGAANPAWSRIRQRRLPAPLVQVTHTEAAYGAALLARQGVME